MIRTLQLEMERIEAGDSAIGAIPECQRQRLKPKSNRGRKSMESDERQDVSQRMKEYWTGRREAS
jgi:hypothetical protein